MAIERCHRCDRWVDMDKFDDIEYIGKDLTPVCFDCLTEAEFDLLEAERNEPSA